MNVSKMYFSNNLKFKTGHDQRSGNVLQLSDLGRNPNDLGGLRKTARKSSEITVNLQINPFVPNAPFLYPFHCNGVLTFPPPTKIPPTPKPQTFYFPLHTNLLSNMTPSIKRGHEVFFFFLRLSPKPDSGYLINYPADIFLFQMNRRNTRKRYEIRSNVTIKTTRRRQ